MPDTGNSQTLRLRLAELMAGLDGAVREKIRLSPDRSVLDYSREIAGNLPFMALAAFLQENCGTRAVPHPAAEFALRFAGRGGETETGRTEVQRRLVSLLAEAGESGASDVHIADMGAYGLVRFRVRGEMRPAAEISGTLARRLIAVAFNGLGQQNGTPGFSQASRQDARIVSRSVLPPGVHSVRLHAEPIQSDTASRGTFLAMRLLTGADGVTGSLGERLAALGYSEDQCRLMASLAGSRGLTLLAGPTGHGKSTTLRHVMESMVISRPDQSYLSVEDPPEYPMAGVRQIQVPTSGGDRASAYADAIAGAMRCDPDVIMIGEIRWPAAAAAALDAALTGHAVWTTVHAADAFAIARRLTGMLTSAGVPDPRETLFGQGVCAGLICQRLMSLNCPRCSLPLSSLTGEARRSLLPEELEEFLAGAIGPSSMGGVRLRNPDGCPACGGQGILSRAAAAEIVDCRGAVGRLLARGGGRGSQGALETERRRHHSRPLPRTHRERASRSRHLRTQAGRPVRSGQRLTSADRQSNSLLLLNKCHIIKVMLYNSAVPVTAARPGRTAPVFKERLKNSARMEEPCPLFPNTPCAGLSARPCGQNCGGVSRPGRLSGFPCGTPSRTRADGPKGRIPASPGPAAGFSWPATPGSASPTGLADSAPRAKDSSFPPARARAARPRDFPSRRSFSRHGGAWRRR